MDVSKEKNVVRSLISICAHRTGLVLQLAILATSTYWFLTDRLVCFAVGIVCAGLSLLPRILMRDQALRVPGDMCLSILLFAHIVFGMQMGLYETSVIYDKFMHTLGSGAIAGLVIAVLDRYCRKEQLVLPVPLFAGSVIGIVVTLGVMWEVFEFTIDQTGLFQAQRGLSDTMFDLLADLLGVIVVMGFLVLVRRIELPFTHQLAAQMPNTKRDHQDKL